MIVIIGAGISGLSLAYFLENIDKEYILLESTDKPGGYIKTKNSNNCILESGPNSLLADKEILDFLKDIGLENLIIEADTVNKSRYIYKNGKYRKLPDNPLALFTNSFFSLKTKWSVIKEFNLPEQHSENETVAEFFERRFSKEVVDYAVQPFITGIYAGSASELLVEETFPFLGEYEKTYGSVLKGLMKNKPVRKTSLTFDGGMETMTQQIAKKIDKLMYNATCEHIEKTSKGYNVRYRQGQAEHVIEAEKVVFALPAYAAEKITDGFPELQKAMQEINYSSVTGVHTIYREETIERPLKGFGALNPDKENQFASGTIFNSYTFDKKCPPGKILFTSFIKGLRPESDEEIKSKIHQELSANFGINSQPIEQHIKRWTKAIPQYDINYKKAKPIFEKYENQNLYICANWYKGISLSDCIKKAKKLADSL